jgi:uncharacterized membrane protein YhaH (DUF805 family)
MKSYINAMRRYFDFSGRSTRAQFWLFSLVMLVMVIIAIIIDSAISSQPGIITALVVIAHLLPSLAVTVRRLHDINRSSWWVFIQLVPLIGLIVMLVFLCSGSTQGPNRFGPAVGGQGGAAAAGGAPVAASGGADINKLEKLASLKASGAIDDAEYERMKSQLLGGSAA